MHLPETYSAVRGLPLLRGLAAAARSLRRAALLSTSALAAAPAALRGGLGARLTRSAGATPAAPLRPGARPRGGIRHDPLATWLEDEPSACFLTDGRGSVLAANRAARRDGTAPAALLQILAPLVAEPESHARRLLDDLQRSGAAAHAIGAPSGPYLLSARRVGPDLAAWRLKSPVDRDAAPVAEPDLPILSLDPTGAPRAANGAFQRVFGTLPNRLDDLIQRPADRSGRRPPRGRAVGVPVAVPRVRSAGPGRTPRSPPPSAYGRGEPPSPSAAWDTLELLPLPLLRLSPSGVVQAANRAARTILLLPPMA